MPRLPNNTTLATEVAVNAAITAAVAVVDGKVNTLNANAETPGSVDYKIAQGYHQYAGKH